MSAMVEETVVRFHTGDVVRKWLEADGLTGRELASLSGLDKNTITAVLSGKNTRTDTLTTVVSALGRTMPALYRALQPDLSDEQRDLLQMWERLWPSRRSLLLDLMREFVSRDQ